MARVTRNALAVVDVVSSIRWSRKPCLVSIRSTIGTLIRRDSSVRVSARVTVTSAFKALKFLYTLKFRSWFEIGSMAFITAKLWT